MIVFVALLLLIQNVSVAATFQKVVDEAVVSFRDIERCVSFENGTLDVWFNEEGQTKLSRILNQDNTKMNIIVGDSLLVSLDVPNAMNRLNRFKVTVDKSGVLAEQWRCKQRTDKTEISKVNK